MIQKEVSKISDNLFVRKFVLSMIRSLECKNFPPKGKVCIDSELVPKISNNIAHASMGQKIIPPRIKKNVPTKNSLVQSRSNLISPIKNVQLNETPINPISQKSFPPQRNFPVPVVPPQSTFHPQESHPPQNVAPKIVEAWQKSPVQIPSSILDSPELSKIRQLLRDPSVFSVECLGNDKPLRIIRSGQRQMTNISLNKEEISTLLKKFSSESRIPLFDGVFKVAVENLLLNAVISGIIGSKFIIKKQIH